MMNTQTSPFRWLAALLSVTMLFGVVGPLVQHVCAMDMDAPVAASHCDEKAPAHGPHADAMDMPDAMELETPDTTPVRDDMPMSDCAESGMDCCTVEAHAADRVRVDLRSPERVAAALVLAVLTDVDLGDDAAHVPLPPDDDVVPDRPVRLHLWTATFLN